MRRLLKTGAKMEMKIVLGLTFPRKHGPLPMSIFQENPREWHHEESKTHGRLLRSPKYSWMIACFSSTVNLLRLDMTMLPFLQQAFVFRLSTFGGAYHLQQGSPEFQITSRYQTRDRVYARFLEVHARSSYPLNRHAAFRV
jgi:hypothetical protein